MRNNFDDIARAVPLYSCELLSVAQSIKDTATDIRFSIGFAPIIFSGEKRYFLQNCKSISSFDMEELIFEMCENSVYKHIEEIKNGFISVKNRFRAGLCGTATIKDDVIENISDIKSIMIRVPRFIYGSAEEIRQNADNFNAGLLIVGEPSSGKTTALRDIIVILSEKRLVVLDERYELTGGFAYNDVDVLYGYPKEIGISHAVRNLGASHIICDEIEYKDFDAIKNASACGVSIIATVHGNLENGLRPLIKELLYSDVFKYIAELEGRNKPCKLRKVWRKDELLKNFGCSFDMSCVHSFRDT